MGYRVIGKPRTNPFFTLLMFVSLLFVVTTLGYLMGPFLARRAAEGLSGPSAVGDWFERKGVVALAIEFCAMFILAILAMSTDRYFEPKKPPDSKTLP